MDFQGFLNDLQDWELSRKDKAQKMKSQSHQKEQLGSSSRNTGLVGVESASRGETLSFDDARSTSGQYDFSKNKDPIHCVHSSLISEDVPDAASEKELGNEYFKQKKFKEAIDCYSRSIAFLPTAVAYANRAMAYIKLRRFQEAEYDCTEALNLDDRYIKAYSRRATARKELGKLKESMEDAEFALRLEPNNQEIKKQYADSKSLHEKTVIQKASVALRNSLEGSRKGGKSETNVNGHSTHPFSNGTQSERAEVKDLTKGNDKKIPTKASMSVEEVDNNAKRARSRTGGQKVDASKKEASPVESVKRNLRIGKKDMKASVQQLASQAASRAMAEAAKNVTPPTSAYQFEVSWRGFSGDQALQYRLLKAVSPQELPHVFKNALSAALLIDIIKCVASFFTEDMDLAVSYIENLTKVARFDMLMMCLSSKDKDDLRKIWDEVFCNEATPMEYAEILDNFRSKYCLRQ